jgi:hypothetical protein
MRRDLVLVIAQLADVRDLGIVGLSQQTGETRCIQQRVLPAVHRNHAEPERFMTHRCAELVQRLAHELERACERKAAGSDIA